MNINTDKQQGWEWGIKATSGIPQKIYIHVEKYCAVVFCSYIFNDFFMKWSDPSRVSLEVGPMSQERSWVLQQPRCQTFCIQEHYILYLTLTRSFGYKAETDWDFWMARIRQGPLFQGSMGYQLLSSRATVSTGFRTSFNQRPISTWETRCVCTLQPIIISNIKRSIKCQGERKTSRTEELEGLSFEKTLLEVKGIKGSKQ